MLVWIGYTDGGDGRENELRGLILFLLLAQLAACTSLRESIAPKRKPEIGFRYIELLVEDAFDTGDRWRRYDNSRDLFLGFRAGAYRLDFSGRKYVWTQRVGEFENVVIEAEAAQVSDYNHNAYGLACRLDPANSGRGYFFLISGDGYASIRWSNGRSLEPIVSAAPSDRIRRGRASNRIRVVCIDDYLALWVNGEFVAEARDRRAADGEVGLAGVMNYAGQRLTVDFDDVKVWRAAVDSGER